MNRNKVIIAVAALVGLVLLLFWVQGAFHSKIRGGTTALPAEKSGGMKTAKAELIRGAGDVTVSGTVSSRETARVASRILGYVIELNVDAGSKVKKGDVLLRVDTKEMAERESQARAALESAEAELVKARNDFERYKILFEKESIARKDYDDALARYETAQAAEKRARAALDEAGTMLSYGTVTAPFDGLVAERSVNVGDLASPGRPLMTIYMPGTLELVAAVGEQYAEFLRPDVPVRLEVQSVGIKQDSAIREVVPQRDERTRTITVKAPLTEAPGLGPGLYGTMTFHTAASEVIVIPKAALKVVGQLETVRVLEDGTVKVRYVKTGRALAGEKMEILSGINPGDAVVLESNQDSK